MSQAALDDLAVALTAHDSTRTIGRTLDTAIALTRRVVVVDSGSTDGTIERCKSMGAEVIHQPWLGHVGQKQFAIDQCRDSSWVLLLDSDESIEARLGESIRTAVLENDPAYDGWAVNRKVWFLGGWLHHTYQPQWRLRLVRSGRATVVGSGPHDRLEVPGKTGRLQGDLRHDSWADLRDLAQRQIAYAELAGTDDDRGGSMASLLLSPPAAMLKQLVLRRGYRDGVRGVIAAGMTFNAKMLKHAFLAAKRGNGLEGESRK